MPDWMAARPRGWSYRDIVFARMLGWLRSKHMPRPVATQRLGLIRELLTASVIDPAIPSDGTIFLIGEERIDRVTGQQAFDGVTALLDVFGLAGPIEGVTDGALWGPSLLRPSKHTYISPWVIAGEPCIVDSRVPTSSIHALNSVRGLDTDAIQALYPFVTVEAVDDALDLERRLRAA